MSRIIEVRVKNGMDYESLEIDLDRLEADGQYKGETNLYWPFSAKLVNKPENEVCRTCGASYPAGHDWSEHVCER